MGSRYLVTGVQLGMIKTLVTHSPTEAVEELSKIIENQYIGDSKNSIEDDVLHAKRMGI